ncbi:phage tail tape measure protein [bacterium]|nr:phage tail tape measure protein [bacterium]
MADDVSANINVNFDTRDALRQLRALQAQLSRFNQALTQGNVAAMNAQKGLTDQLIQSINATGKFVASQKEIATSTKGFTDALEKNKLSLKEYFRYTAAAATADTKVFSRAFAAEREVLNRARRDRVKLLQSQYVQLTNANGDLVKVLQVVPKHLEMVNGRYADYATRVQMAAQRQQFLNQLLKQGSTQLLNFGKNTQWAGRQLMVGLTIPLTMFGTAASRAFMDMEQAVIKFSRVYGDMLTSTESTDKAIANIKRLGLEFTKYGIAVKDTVDLASQAAAMGLVGDALEAQVRQATRLSVLGQVEQQQALETTISLQNAFGISSEQLAQKINFLNAVENQTVLSIEDLTIAIPKAGPVVKQLGGSVEDLAFFMTAMKEGGINASEGANALKSGLASLINPSKKSSEFLAELGINIKGIVEANAGDLKGTVVGFARALDTLDPLNRARAIEQLFGKFQFARLSTLFQNVSKGGTQAARAFDLAGASVEELAILSERELAKVENAVGVKFKKTLEQLKLELIPVGKAFLEAVTPIVKFVGDILKKFNGLSDGTKKIVTVITGVLGVIAPVALMSIGLVANGVANLVKFFAMLRGGMAKLNGQNQVLGGGFDYLTQQEIENLAETNALHTSHRNLIATFNVEAAAAEALARAYANASSQARALAASSPGLFNAAPGVQAVTPPKIPGYADGVVSVPGTGNGDTVPAMLTPGETVVSKENTQKYGPLLQAIATDSVPGYKKGRYDLAATQTDRSFASGTVKPGATAEFIINELGRIRNLTDKELIDAATRTGKTLVDTSEQSLEQFRETIISEFKQIVLDAKDIVGPKVSADEIKAVGGKFDPEKGYSRMGSYAPQFDQQRRSQFSHLGEGVSAPLDKISSEVNITSKKILDELDFTVKALKAAGEEMPQARAVGLSAYSAPGYVNRAMAASSKEGQANFEKPWAIDNPSGMGMPVVDAFMESFEKDGAQKWKRTTDAFKINFDNVSKEFKQYDDALLTRVQQWKQENPNGFFNDEVFSQLEAEVRQTAPIQVRQIMNAADNILTAIRVPLTDAQAKIVKDAAQLQGVNVPGMVEGSTGNRKAGNKEYRTVSSAIGTFDESGSSNTPKSIAKQVKSDLEEAENIAETNSPSKRTERLGKDIGDGLVQGLQQKETEVKSQSDRLAEAAVPRQTAAQTQAKIDKMDLGNKAFYDDINTPELRDQRQVLKSLDRQRRKKGVGKGKVELAKQEAYSSADDKELQVLIQADIEAARQRQKASEEAAQAQTEVAATVKDNRDINVKIKGNEINIQQGTEEQAQTQEQITAAKQEQLVAAENGNVVTNQTTATLTEMDAATKTNVDATQGIQEDLITQEQLSEAITQTEQERAATVEQIQNVEEQTLQEKIKERNAAEQNAQQEMNDASIPNAPQSKNVLDLNDALEESENYLRDENGQIVMGSDGNPKKDKRIIRGKRREKVGRFAGKASGALGMATVAAGMMGAPPQVTAALGTASMVAQFAPMLAGMGPVGWAAAGIMAVGAGAYMLNKHFNKMAAEAGKFVIASSATRESMKKMGELTGKVGASQIMDKRRQGSQYGKYTENFKAQTTFGNKFLGEQIGKDEMATFKKNMTDFSKNKAVDDFALKLATQVADGVLSTEQAHSIGAALALSLGDQSIEMGISGRLGVLLGPNGENLLKEPLKTRMGIVANAVGKQANVERDIENKRETGESARKDIGALAALNMTNLELITMIGDQTQLAYETEKKKLETQIAGTTDLQKKIQLQTQLDTLNKQNVKDQATINAQVIGQIQRMEASFAKVYSDSVWGSQAMREDAYFDSSRGTVESMFKGTDQEEASKTFLNQTEAIGVSYDNKTNADGTALKTGFGTERAAQTFAAKMEFMVGSKILSPEEANNWLNLFEGDLANLNAMMTIGFRTQGAGKTKELINMFTGFKDKKVAKTVINNVILTKTDPAEFDKTMEALKSLQSMDGFTLDMEVVLKDPTALARIQKQLEEIEKLKNNSNFDKMEGGLATGSLEEAEKAVPSMKPVLDKLKADTEEFAKFSKLGSDERTEYLQKLAQQYEYEQKATKEQLAQDEEYYVSKQLGLRNDLLLMNESAQEYKDAVAKFRSDFQAMDAATRAQYKINTGTVGTINSKTGPGTTPPGGKGSDPLDFLDALAMRIKNVRDGAFDATTPLKSMIAAFTNKKAQKDASRMFDIFDGLQQRLLKFKAPKEFRDMIYGMSNEDFKKLANLKGDKQLFKFAEGKPRTKANITGLTKSGQAVMQTIREADLGDYEFQQGDEALQNVKDQNSAYKQLVESGMDVKDALKVIEDQAVASAIAAGALGKKGSAEMTAFVAKINKANDALEKQAVLNDLIAKNADFEIYKQMPDLASKMKALGLSTEQMAAVLDDPALAKVLIEDLKDGKIDAKAIADYLNSIEEKKVIDIQVKMNQGDFAGAAASGRDIVDQMFDIQERMIRTGADPRSTKTVDTMKANEKAIKAAEKEARVFRKQIEDINEEIAKAQRDIEINYTRPIEDATEKVNDLNRALEVGGEYQIGDKKMTLDFKLSNRYMEQLNTESGKLSNDLTVIGHQEDEINKKYDKQVEALTKVNQINSEIAKQQQNQLTLADALSQGDIAAAARAAQQSRADSISLAGDQAMAALEAGRKNELDALVGPESGLTKEQINERQYQIQQEIYRIETSPERLAIKAEQLRLEDEIYKLEESREAALLRIREKEDKIYEIQEKQLKPLEKKIEDLTYANQLLQEEIDAMVEGITVMGMTRDEWERMKTKIDASSLASQNFTAALAGLLAAVNKINSAWDSIIAKIQSYSSLTSSTTAPIVKQAEDIVKATDKSTADAKTVVDAAANLANAQAYVNKLNADAKTASGRNYVTDAQMDRALAAADNKFGTNLYGGANPYYSKAPVVDEQTKIAAMRDAARAAEPIKNLYRANDRSSGGLIKYMANGGLFRPINTDTVPAMLTPGEFIMSRYAVNSYGLDKMRAINNGDSVGDSVYNYSISVNVQSDANPDEIARVVMNQIRQVDSKRLRGAVI